MPARTGAEYIANIKENGPEVYLHGERVKDVTTHPALRRGVETLARMYDMQHDPAIRDEMTYVSPTTGDRVGTSFITPRTKDDLHARRTMMRRWARATFGMMGRSPDFMNVSIMAMAAAGDYSARPPLWKGRRGSSAMRPRRKRCASTSRRRTPESLRRPSTATT